MLYCAVVLNLCYNQLIIGSSSSCTFLLGCSLPIYENMIWSIDSKPSEGQLVFIFFFVTTKVPHSSSLLFFGFFSDEPFSSDLRMSKMIEGVFTEGLIHCPCCTSFEFTENGSSTLKNWVIHECPVICPSLQNFFPLGLLAPELSSMFLLI